MNGSPEPTPDAVARPVGLPPVPVTAIAAVVGARTVGDPPDVLLSGVTANSAWVQRGDLFAALPGRNLHGAERAPAALAAGATAILTDAEGLALLGPLADDVTVLVVDDPRAVVGAAADEIYSHPSQSVDVVGITGTSGKTTTTFLVKAGLDAAGRPTGLIGTVGVTAAGRTFKTPFTTPEAPELHAMLAVMAQQGVATVAMEVSSHALRLARVGGIRFAVGGFTNLSQDHLDFHTDMEDYFAAKSLLFDGRARREVVVVDDEWGRRLVTPDTVTVSTTSAARWRASDIVVASDGSTTFDVTGDVGSFRAGCRIPGQYNVANALLALAVLHECGVDAAAAAPAVAGAQVPGRMQRVECGQPFLVLVDYSHKPAGVSGALTALRPLTTGRRIVVLGCGGDRDRQKRPVMGQVAAQLADVVVVTDDNPRSEDPATIRRAVLDGTDLVPAGERAQVVEIGDRRAAIEFALAAAAPGDSVLVAGKGHETGQEIAGVVVPFDDTTVAQDALTRLGYSGPIGSVPTSQAGQALS